MTAEEVLGKVKAEFGDAIREAEARDRTVLLTADGTRNFEICRALHGMGFDYLNCLSGVDWKDRFEVVYDITSLRFPTKVHLRVTTPHDDPRVRSVASLWATANWHEREAWDLLGIRFEGHPDLRRILLSEDWVGHPLRKDYVDEGRYVQFTPYGETKKAASQAAHAGAKAGPAAKPGAKPEPGPKPAAGQEKPAADEPGEGGAG